METSAVSASTPAATFIAPTSGDTSSGQDFASILNSQTVSGSSLSSDTSTVDAAEKGLSAYSPGQVTALSATSGSTALKETTSTSSSSASTSTSGSESASSSEGASESTEESGESTGVSAGGKGFPAEVNSEWTPAHMQFYDESTGKWVDDNIPHRIVDNGDLQYYADGEWHKDTAVKHRMLDENGNPIAMVDENGKPVASETASSGASTTSDNSTEGSSQASQDTDLTPDIYFNEQLQMWKLCNLPEAVDKNGKKVYYWGDSWHSDSWQHHGASGSGEVVANDPAKSAGLASNSSAESSTASNSGTDSGSSTSSNSA